MAAITYKCPNCGGGLIFNPETQQYKCEYCLSDFKLEELQEQASGQERPAAEEKDLFVYHCPSCGAEIVTDGTTAATFCYYCHNPVLLEGMLEGRYHPDYVAPFAIDRNKAEEIFARWIGRKRYAPAGFYSREQIESMTGVYFPYWLYSCQINGELEAEGTRLRVWDEGNLRYTERKIYQIRRKGRLQVEHVTRNALKKANRKLVEGVLPFQMEGLKPFDMGYLSGFMAEKRDVEKQELAAGVEQEIRDFAIDGLKNSAEGYSGLTVGFQKADVQKAQWQYGLFPVWTLTYKEPSDGKIYYFALNGQTGKVCGEIPVDKKKLFVLFITVFFPVLVLLLIGGLFL